MEPSKVLFVFWLTGVVAGFAGMVAEVKKGNRERKRQMIPEDKLEYKDPRYAEPLNPWLDEEATREEEE